MKIKKTILWGLGALIGLVLVGLIGAFVYIDRIAEAGLEKGGTAALKVETLAEGVDVSPFRGKVAVEGLSIANPERFVSEKLFTCGLIRVDADIWSFLGDEAHVREIVIESPKLTIEPGRGGSNVTAVLKNLGSDAKPEAPAEPEPDEAGSEMAFRVDRIAVTGAVARFQIKNVGQNVPLPDIELVNISNADGTPVMLRDIIRQVIAQMTAAAAREGRGIVPDATIKGLVTDMKELGGTAAGLVRGLGERAKDLGEGAKDLGKKAIDVGGKVKEIGKLLPLGRKKEEEKE